MNQRRLFRLGSSTALLVILACIGIAYADEDHGRARDAVRRGDVLPLAKILEMLEDRLGGEVIEVEFEREDGRYVYEFEIVTPSGQVQEVYVDAKTAKILSREDE